MRLFELTQPLTEAKKDTVVFTFGRFNPPTIGHQKLVSKVSEVATNQNADHIVYLSKTQKPGKDPLSWQDKYGLFKKMFPSINVSRDHAIINPYMAMEALGKKYDNVIMVVGSDRVERFRGDMQKYLDEWGIKNFEVVSAGERDPDAEGAEGMSASKARQLAYDGDFAGFAQALPSTINNATKKVVYNKIRKNLGESKADFVDKLKTGETKVERVLRELEQGGLRIEFIDGTFYLPRTKGIWSSRIEKDVISLIQYIFPDVTFNHKSKYFTAQI